MSKRSKSHHHRGKKVEPVVSPSWGTSFLLLLIMSVLVVGIMGQKNVKLQHHSPVHHASSPEEGELASKGKCFVREWQGVHMFEILDTSASCR